MAEGDGADEALLVVARDLEVRYGRGAQSAVSGVSLTLGPGEGLLVTGPAGSGKTSLLRGLLGLAAAGGAIRLLGGRRAPRRRCGAWATRPRGGPSRPDGGRARSRPRRPAPAACPTRRAAAADACARAGLTRVDAPVLTLDVDDARRLTLACALTGRPDLLVLDDPFEFPEMRLEVSLARERGAGVLVACAEPGNLPRSSGAP